MKEKSIPTISVIVPVYKTEPFLSRCINSIINQSFSDFELILVDDGSPDNCPKICDDYSKKDERVIVVHKSNGGLSDARNAGLDVSQGEWITYIDSDDWIHKDYLDLLYRACINNGVKISMCNYVRTDGKETQPQEIDPNVCIESPEQTWCSKPLNDVIATWGKIYHRSISEDIRFPVGKLNEDAFSTHKILFRCDRIAVLGAVLYYYYQNPESITGKGWYLKRMDSIEAFREQVDFFHEKGLINAERISTWKYFENLEWHLCELKKRPDCKNIYDQTLQELRHMLIKHKDQMLSYKGADYIYHKYFPFRSFITSRFAAIAKKIGITK